MSHGNMIAEALIDRFGAGGASFATRVTRLVTAAEIIDLHDNPVELVASPGAGKGFQVLSFVMVYRFGTIQYALPEDPNTGVRLQVGPLAAVEQDYSTWETDPYGLPSWFAGTNDWVVELNRNGQTAVMPPDLVEDQPLAFGNPGTDFIDGDGTLTVIVDYATIDL